MEDTGNLLRKSLLCPVKSVTSHWMLLPWQQVSLHETGGCYNFSVYCPIFSKFDVFDRSHAITHPRARLEVKSLPPIIRSVW